MVGYGSFAATPEAVETAVKGHRYIAGNRFSAADVHVGSQIGFSLQFGSIEARPSFIPYWQGQVEHPAFAHANAAFSAALPKHF